ncbi:hypothetical protein HMPREF2898_06575 [Atopobium sp. HMSC064B08]|nr:hypothetical protein HMPREF2898_06575 [Atopobium sp. HMSC064B08]
MHKQEIYFGAPGSGKSHSVDEMIKNLKEDLIKFRVTIHPEFTYSDFVGQLLPCKTINAGDNYFEFVPGPFTIALREAFSDTNREVYLILEELSRGNVAAIFGDIFQLLDRDEYFKSKYPIVNENVASLIPEIIGSEIYLPSNFNIISTVNINDQSVFPMDTAFKRRFDWIYVSSNPAIDNASGSVNKKLNNPKLSIATPHSRIDTNWLSFYTALNKYIVDKNEGMGRNEDRQIGQFFLKFGEQDVVDTYSSDPMVADTALTHVNNVIKNKLLLYLWQDVQGISAFGAAGSLFAMGINSFDDLFNSYPLHPVFSDAFLDNFLGPNANIYPYK